MLTVASTPENNLTNLIEQALLTAWGTPPDPQTAQQWEQAAYEYAQIAAAATPQPAQTARTAVMEALIAKATSQNWGNNPQTWNNITVTTEEQNLIRSLTGAQGKQTSQYKPGDWVTNRVADAGPWEITQINQDTLTVRSLDGNLIANWNEHNVQPWQPRAGDQITNTVTNETLTVETSGPDWINGHRRYDHSTSIWPKTNIKPAQK